MPTKHNPRKGVCLGRNQWMLNKIPIGGCITTPELKTAESLRRTASRMGIKLKVRMLPRSSPMEPKLYGVWRLAYVEPKPN